MVSFSAVLGLSMPDATRFAVQSLNTEQIHNALMTGNKSLKSGMLAKSWRQQVLPPIPGAASVGQLPSFPAGRFARPPVPQVALIVGNSEVCLNSGADAWRCLPL